MKKTWAIFLLYWATFSRKEEIEGRMEVSIPINLGNKCINIAWGHLDRRVEVSKSVSSFHLRVGSVFFTLCILPPKY